MKGVLKLQSVVLCLSIIILLLSIRTVFRNMNWSTEAQLTQHDLQLDPSSYQLHLLSANASYFAGNTKGEETALLRAIQLFPSGITYSALGNAYLRTNQPKKAIAPFAKSLSYNPNLALSWIFLATAEYDSGDKKSAVRDARKGYAISPNKLFGEILNAIEHNYSYQLY